MTTEAKPDRPASPAPAAAPYHDLPSARAFVIALSNIYMAVGLPLPAALAAALADYRSFDLPTQCPPC